MEHTACVILKCREAYLDVFDEENPSCLKLILRLAYEASHCISLGYTTFICTLGSTVELLFAEAVLDLKRVYSQKPIRLCVIRCPVNDYLSKSNYLSRYEKVLIEAEPVSISEALSGADFIKKADKYMREQSSYILALNAQIRPYIKDISKTEVAINLREYCPKHPPELILIK